MFTRSIGHSFPKFLSFSKFSFSSSQFQHNLPVLLDGFPIDESAEPFSSITRHFLRTFDPQLEKGFQFAFANLLEAFQSLDLDFLQSNLEPGFFNKIADYPENLKKADLELGLPASESKIHLNFNEISLIFGVHFQRDQNPKDLYKTVMGGEKNRLFSYKIYSPQKEGNFVSLIRSLERDKPPLLQIPVYFKSLRSLKFLPKGEKLPEEQTRTSQYHKVLFECAGNFMEEELSLGKLLWGLVRKGREAVLIETFQTLFLKHGNPWRISDVDEFMGGNEFTTTIE